MGVDQASGHRENKETNKAISLEQFHTELDSLADGVQKNVNQAELIHKHSFFGLPSETKEQKSAIVDIFSDLENEIPGFGTLSPLVMGQLIRNRLSKVKEKNSEGRFSVLFEKLKHKEISNRNYLDQVLALTETDRTAVPPEFVSQYQNFHKLLSPTLVSDESERKVIEQAFNALDFAANPDPIIFIQEKIFGDPNETEISESTQNKIAKAFELTPYKVVTGSDVQNAYRETIIDPETGKTQPRFTESNPLKYRPGISAYNGARGEQMIRFEVDPPVQFDTTGWNPNMVTDVSEYGAMFVGFQEAGVSNFMVHNFHLPNALDPQFDPLDAVRSRQVVEAILGFGEGYDGKIYGGDKTNYFRWFAQLLTPKGDTAQGDFDIEASHKALEYLGIRDEKGNLNLTVLKVVGSYARGIYGTGSPNFKTLKAHLHS